MVTEKVPKTDSNELWYVIMTSKFFPSPAWPPKTFIVSLFAYAVIPFYYNSHDSVKALIVYLWATYL